LGAGRRAAHATNEPKSVVDRKIITEAEIIHLTW
jgi:hypothetical protein